MNRLSGNMLCSSAQSLNRTKSSRFERAIGAAGGLSHVLGVFGSDSGACEVISAAGVINVRFCLHIICLREILLHVRSAGTDGESV